MFETSLIISVWFLILQDLQVSVPLQRFSSVLDIKNHTGNHERKQPKEKKRKREGSPQVEDVSISAFHLVSTFLHLPLRPASCPSSQVPQPRDQLSVQHGCPLVLTGVPWHPGGCLGTDGTANSGNGCCSWLLFKSNLKELKSQVAATGSSKGSTQTGTDPAGLVQTCL